MTENSKIMARLTIIPVCVILNKIQKGDPVEYDHVRIIGDLNLDPSKLKDEEQVTRTKYQIKDLRLFSENDLRFLKQFTSAV